MIYDEYGSSLSENVYESLFFYNGTNGAQAVPWLAQSANVSPDGKTISITLRSGIRFQDGEPLNSTAVYFSYNRLLVFDGSSPVSHGTQASWIVQQLANRSLSTVFSGSQPYSEKWVREVLAENFVQITGPLTLTLHVQNPTGAELYTLTNVWGNILAPDYVIQHDIQLWSQPKNGYSLPYPTIQSAGNSTSAIEEYYLDYISTCNSGVTLSGCGITYLDGSYEGSLAGTGAYTIASVDPSTEDITLQANPNYWGGPYGTFHPHIKTVIFKYVPSQATRTLDLLSASKSGQAMGIDVSPDSIYDVANRTKWLNQHQLASSIPGVSIYGPYSQYAVWFDIFAQNVTNPFTSEFYTFQPFADYRLRLAFADAVNLTLIDQNVDNNLGLVANGGGIPPGLPPEGSYNSSMVPTYSFNPDKVQSLLLDAMMHPLTQFRFFNGSIAPLGLFNNTFGCTTLNKNNQCSNPVTQTVNLVYGTGQTIDEAIYTLMASVINNASLTYNMGLTVNVTPQPAGQMISMAFSGHVYSWAESPYGWSDDYPWTMDFLTVMYAPGGAYTSAAGWNISAMKTYWEQAQSADASLNNAALAQATNKMVELGNQEVMDLWTFNPLVYTVMTSNVHGFFFNPAWQTVFGNPEEFLYLYIGPSA